MPTSGSGTQPGADRVRSQEGGGRGGQTNLAVPTSDVSTEPATCIRVFTVSMGNMTQCSETPAIAPAIMYLQPATSPIVRRRGDCTSSRLHLRSASVLPKGQAALFPTLDLVVVRHDEPHSRRTAAPWLSASCFLLLAPHPLLQPHTQQPPHPYPNHRSPPLANTLPQQSALRVGDTVRLVGSGAQRSS